MAGMAIAAGIDRVNRKFHPCRKYSIGKSLVTKEPEADGRVGDVNDKAGQAGTMKEESSIMTMQKKMLSAMLAMAFAVTGLSLPGQPIASAATSTAHQTAANKVIEVGKQYLHTPYKFGSSSKTTRTFDCSSFVQRVYKTMGINLPRSSRQQSKVGTPVSKSNLQVGDLIFFRSYGSKSNRITHVAIYAGNNKILHTYGKPGVTFSTFDGTSWEKRFVTARRVL